MSQCSQSRSSGECYTKSIGNETSIDYQEDDGDSSHSTLSTLRHSQRQTNTVKKKRPSSESLQQQMLEIEREKLRVSMKPDDEEDEVRLFCLSIVPKKKGFPLQAIIF